MSREYAEKRIRQALEMFKGNETKARQQIIAWTYEDTKLLQALTQPHITGIVAHAIGRVVNMKDEGDIPPEPEIDLSEGGEFGIEILKAIAGGGTARFGQENASA